ncbi:hypothetical protein NC651_040272 [Populus alba x Populus x berolinensis]|nr:hypothetical protein NC651_040272 [Populus alba x Populus x berolinensis]
MFSPRVLILIICFQAKYPGEDGERTPVAGAAATTMLGNVLVPRLCISALDDPICTREAIPWDECRRILFYDHTEITCMNFLLVFYTLVHTCMYRRKFLNHILQQKQIGHC